MALKAFHDNPCIGGFGGESTVAFLNSENDKNQKNSLTESSGDALCQIVKELIDNAVDACVNGGRVKVEVYAYEHDDSILQVKISDTGEGMEDIQACVSAFQSSKASGGQTAGRYGIGLTLCMLHAQRLVSNSYSCITSATKDQNNYSRAFYVVDTNGDSVICKKTEELPKPSEGESGTCVSVLVPGGVTARLAWVRLSNYFTRFRLRSNRGNGPDMEILAPTLSKQPIFVRVQLAGEEKDDKNQNPWHDGLDDDESNSSDSRLFQKKRKPLTKAQQRNEIERKAVFRSAQSFLGCQIKFENVACSVRNIRMVTKSNETSASEEIPKLQVDMIINPDAPLSGSPDGPVASMKLIRMVNNIPLLDSAEGCACGLVHGIASKLVWGSFGLHVAQQPSTADQNTSWTPQYNVRDSDQVAPFFQQRHQHGLWTGNDDSPNENEESTNDNHKRKRKSISEASFAPAKARLGEITVIVKILGAPSSLPLPTLSKGRLPLNHQPIDTALQLGLRECLRSLQRTNPKLLLTPAQLKSAVREVRYIPAMAFAVSKIINTAPDAQGQEACLDVIRTWSREHGNIGASQQESQVDSNKLSAACIQIMTEKQLKLSVTVKQRAVEEAKRRKKNRKADSGDDYSDDLDGSDVDTEQVKLLMEKDEKEMSQCSSRLESSTPSTSSVWNDGDDSSKNSPMKETQCNSLKGKEVIITTDADDEGDDDEWW